MNGSWRPIMAPSASSGRPVTAPSVVTGAPSAPKATGAVLKIRVKTSASSGWKPTRDQQRAGDGDRRAEAGDAFQQAPKQKPMTTSTMRRSLGRWSSTQPRKASKRPERDGDVVEQQGVEHDPHDRPEREGPRRPSRRSASPTGIAPDANGDDSATTRPASEACQAGRRKHAEQHEHHRDRAAPPREATAAGCPPTGVSN